MAECAEVLLLAFGSAVEVFGWRQRRFELSGAPRLRDVIAALEQEYPRLAAARGRVRYAINSAYADLDAPLHGGDEIAIIPPVSGGDSDAPPVAARLVRGPINLGELIEQVQQADCGAIATFLGVVRAEVGPQGQPLMFLDYSAHESMAHSELHRIAAEIRKHFEVERVRAVHRLGRLGVGDSSVALVVSAAHRPAALDACRELIERIKAEVPIFKQEVWSDGGTSWVDPI